MKIEPEIVPYISCGTRSHGRALFPRRRNFRTVGRGEVHVPKFGIAKYAVTVGEVRHFAEVTNYPLANELRTDPRFADPRALAAYLSWIDAVHYVQWLARETGKPYRLIRDAEYERNSPAAD